MKCFTCTKRTDDYNKDKAICGSCREVLKIDIVNILLEKDRIYLSELNRNKKGRRHIFSANIEDDIVQAYNNKEGSLSILAKKYNVSKSTIFNILRR